jgi:hypothetical protein
MLDGRHAENDQPADEALHSTPVGRAHVCRVPTLGGILRERRG